MYHAKCSTQLPGWNGDPGPLTDGTGLALVTPMTVVTNVLRILSDFGDAAGWLVASLVLFVYGRRLLAENEKAHAALDKKIDTVAEDVKENRRRFDAVVGTLGAKIDTVARDLGAIARDVSFLAGRQAERDRTTGR